MSATTSVKQESETQAPMAERTRNTRTYRPNVDIIEKTDELLVLADVPGAKAEEIDIRFENGTLELHAPIAPRQQSGARVLVNEYGVGDYYRSFQVSETIDASRISANYTDGVLTLHLPKVEAAKPRKINVRA